MKIKYIIVAAGLVLALAGCKKTWLDVNTNPNALLSSTPDYTFTAAVNRTAGTLGPNELGSYWSGQWTQSNTYIISNTIFTYQFNNTNFNYWDGYFDILEDLQYSIRGADALPAGSPVKFFGGAARVMKAYVTQIIVDLYGNIPYTQSLKGLDNLTPAFDDQKAIYEDLIKILDTAITVLKANPLIAAYSGPDIVFGTSSPISLATTRWVQFANSLKLRLLMRQSRITGRDAYIIAEINKAAATTEGFLPAGVDVGANPGYIASTGKQNPFYENWGYNAAGSAQSLARYPRPTAFLYSSLVATNDTFRLKRLAWPNGGEGVRAELLANYTFVPFGIASGYLASGSAYIGSSQIKKGEFARPMILMTNAEIQFMLAEAKQLYGAAVTIPNTAQAYYEQGVRESFRITGTTANNATAATTLLLSSKDLADWSASPDKLKAIWMQKWLALVNYGGLEAWSDYRRTNFPVTPPSASTAANAPRPVRLFYPSSEVAANGANVAAQGTINVFTNRLFWDVD